MTADEIRRRSPIYKDLQTDEAVEQFYHIVSGLAVKLPVDMPDERKIESIERLIYGGFVVIKAEETPEGNTKCWLEITPAGKVMMAASQNKLPDLPPLARGVA